MITHEQLLARGWTQRIPGDWRANGLEEDERIYVVLGGTNNIVSVEDSGSYDAYHASGWDWFEPRVDSQSAILYFRREVERQPTFKDTEWI